MLIKPAHQIPTNSRHGNDVGFSPFSPNLLALVANDHFAISGGGELAVLSICFDGNTLSSSQHPFCPARADPRPEEKPTGQERTTGPCFSGHASVFAHSDAMCCLAWSSHVPNTIVTGCRNGQLILWNIAKPEDSCRQLLYSGANNEVSCVAWSTRDEQPLFVAGAWDGSVRLYDPGRSSPVSSLPLLSSLVYDVRWAPHRACTFAVAAGDGTVRLFERGLAGLTVPAHPGTDALSCDWCPTQQHLLATAAADASVCVWDLRLAHRPLLVLQGHEKAVNKVRYSPHCSSTLATASYDFTTRVWQDDTAPLVASQHGGFTLSVAWSPAMAGLLADCSWDGTLALYVV